MLKLLLINAAFSPALMFVALSNTSTPIEKNDSGTNFFVNKIKSLSSCEDTSIYLEFRDQYMETHAAEYLNSAMSAVEDCEISGIKIQASAKDDADLRHSRGNEILHYFEYHDLKVLPDTSPSNKIASTDPYGIGYTRLSFEFGATSKQAQTNYYK